MEVFFYGLFMDKEELIKRGVSPTNPRIGFLDNYTIKIGNKSSLVKAKGEKAYGVVMSLKKEEVIKLYKDKHVSDYFPEDVIINTESDKQLQACCYFLDPKYLIGSNDNYTNDLISLAIRLNLPVDYIKIIIDQLSN